MSTAEILRRGMTPMTKLARIVTSIVTRMMRFMETKVRPRRRGNQGFGTTIDRGELVLSLSVTGMIAAETWAANIGN
jgi:hypothetical protein